MLFQPSSILALTALALSSLATVNAHGYLKTPKARSWVAAQTGNGVRWNGNNPTREVCPQCLNRGGIVAACGKTDDRNYDFNPSDLGGVAMDPNVQAVFNEGDSIDVEVVLTAHHKGHFSFYACPVTNPNSPPTDDCFKRNPLVFEADLLYGATQDPNHPDRAYIPPLTYSGIVNDNEGSVPGTLYRYRLKLPEGVAGNLVLLQWHYISGNSCTSEGYGDYAFPSQWGELGYGNLSTCHNIPADGDGTPEQFWNCAELTVIGDGTPQPSRTPTSMPSAQPTVAPTTLPPGETTPAPTFEDGIPEISTSARCGVSELDARANCGQECTTQADCGQGEWCWNVQANMCGTRPNFDVCHELAKANEHARCGANEFLAREFCGKPCTRDTECGAGEYCYQTHMNTCDCVADQNQGNRMLRGGATANTN